MLHRTISRLAATFLALTLASLALTFGFASAAGASGDDVAGLIWAAAAPDSYDHRDGGGQFVSPQSVTHVSQLRGSDFACGDTASFFAVVEMGDNPANDAQTVEITSSFRSDTALAPGAGFSEITDIVIDSADPAQNNDGGSAIGVVGFGVDADGAAPFLDDGEVLGGGTDTLFATYVVDDLEANEIVVVRVDVRIDCLPDAAPEGNLTANLAMAGVVADGTGGITFDPIAGGEQIVPLSAVELLGPAPSVDLSSSPPAGVDSADDASPAAEPPAELPLTGDGSNLAAMAAVAIIGFGMISLGTAHRRGVGG